MNRQDMEEEGEKGEYAKQYNGHEKGSSDGLTAEQANRPTDVATPRSNA